MKAVILCGGQGTRLSEETHLKPKPMVEIGPWPILWHIMRIYGHYGIKDFVLALGYKGDIIKDYFLGYRARNSNVSVDLSTGTVEYSSTATVDWIVEMVDTGANTMTGGRIKRLEDRLAKEGTFLATYGDGLADIDIRMLIDFHRSHGKIATVSAVRPPARFGSIALDGDKVKEFKEKPQAGEGWINGGFFVFEPRVFDYIEGDAVELERAPLEKLAEDGELVAYRHDGFFHPMDTIRDRQNLEKMWNAGNAPWKLWES